MKHIFFQITLLIASLFFLLLFDLKAQEAYKIEDVKTPRCDLSEVVALEHFAYQLTKVKENADAKGAIVMFGMLGEAERFLRTIKERFISYGGISPERLITIYGGYEQGRRLELWIIPNNSNQPQFNSQLDITKAVKFDTYYYFEFEYNFCRQERDFIFEVLSDELKKRPTWQAHLTVYPSKKYIIGDEELKSAIPTVSKARRQLKKDVRFITQNFGIESSRIKISVGEFVNVAQMSVWLVPPGAEPPKP